MKKSVLIINTGGTISSVKTPQGYEPSPGFVAKALSQLPALQHAEMPSYTIKEYNPLLDSSNMTLEGWNRIGQDIADHYAQYDGFVILHGTDTMAYTASALSFMLEHLGKPVILTGSQIPLSEVRNDAVDNLLTSLWLCANQPMHEVCVYFNQRLLRGNRTQKISTQQFAAFDSPNSPHLATIGIDIVINAGLMLPQPQQAFHLQTIGTHFIANFRMFPGFSTAVLSSILSQPLDGLILQTYGTGNAQNNDSQFLKLLSTACQNGMIIINCTQCQQGSVKMDQYATGHTLKQAGLLNGQDMTLEAAHCKLLYLLSKYTDVNRVKQQMELSLCGELT